MKFASEADGDPSRTRAVKSVGTNAAYTLASQVIIGVFGIAAAPMLFRHAGISILGLVSLAWMVLAYTPLFDLGFGRAVTYYVARHVGGNAEVHLRTLINLALGAQLGLTFVLGCILWLMAPWLVQSVLTVPFSLQGDAERLLKLLAISTVICSPTAVLCGVLAGLQRFDLIAYNKLAVNLGMLLWPALLSGWSLDLMELVAPLVAIRLGGNLWLAFSCARLVRRMDSNGNGRRFLHNARQEGQRLISFGGWVAVSNLLQLILTHGDKLLVSATLAIGAFASYAVVQETLTKLWVISTAVTAVLFAYFPLLTAEEGLQRWLCVRVGKYINIVMWPLCFLLALFADVLLSLWMGAEFANAATPVARIICMAIWVNSLAQVYASLLQARGRPDVLAKIHLAEIPAYLPVMWYLAANMGIEGVAVAWACRILIDAGMVLYMTLGRDKERSKWPLADMRLTFYGGLILFGTGVSIQSNGVRAVFAVVGLGVFLAVAVWRGDLIQEGQFLARRIKKTGTTVI